MALDPEGVRLTQKGKRRPEVDVRWRELVSGEAAMAVAVNALLAARRRRSNRRPDPHRACSARTDADRRKRACADEAWLCASCDRRMSASISINLPYQHGRVEARRRIEAGFAKVVHSLPSGGGVYSEPWEGDRLVFSNSAIGQTVSGVIEVFDTVVKMEIVLPGVLGLLASSLTSRLQKAGCCC